MAVLYETERGYCAPENSARRKVVWLGRRYIYFEACVYPTIWLCLTLRTFRGKLTTFEVDTERAALARKNFKRARVESIVTLIEGDAHEEVGKLKDPINLLFIDADKEGYLDYLETLLPLMRPGGAYCVSQYESTAGRSPLCQGDHHESPA